MCLQPRLEFVVTTTKAESVLSLYPVIGVRQPELLAAWFDHVYVLFFSVPTFLCMDVFEGGMEIWIYNARIFLNNDLNNSKMSVTAASASKGWGGSYTRRWKVLDALLFSLLNQIFSPHKEKRHSYLFRVLWLFLFPHFFRLSRHFSDLFCQPSCFVYACILRAERILIIWEKMQSLENAILKVTAGLI